MLQSSLSQQICDTHKNKCTWKWVLWRDYPSTFQKYTPCSVWDLGLKWRGGKQLRFFHVLSNVSARLWSRKGINIFGKKKWSLWILRIGILKFFLFCKPNVTNEKFTDYWLNDHHKVVQLLFTIILWTISRCAWCLRTSLAIAASHTSHQGCTIPTFRPWRKEIVGLYSIFIWICAYICIYLFSWKTLIVSAGSGSSSIRAVVVISDGLLYVTQGL